MNENQDINDVNEDQESDDENASVDENQNLKDFILKIKILIICYTSYSFRPNCN